MRTLLSCLPVRMKVAGQASATRTTPERLAASDCPVLLVGETGSGKKMLARWLYEHGPRAAEPFVELDCAKLRLMHLESELFGRQRRTPNGVATRPGLFEIADGGTLFLDRIGELDLAIQPKLLQVLEEHELRRPGGARDRHVDVRLIAATRQNPDRMVRRGKLRADLYGRISAMTLEIPPLRQHWEAIPALAEYFLERLGRKLGRRGLTLSPEALEALVKYRWPGNVRELHHVLERAVLLDRGEVVDRCDLDFEAGNGSAPGAAGAPRLQPLRAQLSSQ